MGQVVFGAIRGIEQRVGCNRPSTFGSALVANLPSMNASMSVVTALLAAKE